MKLAPVWSGLAHQPGVTQSLIHTGQHYDSGMSDVFFRQLGMPEPDHNLGVGSGSHAEQTGRMMMLLESCSLKARPDLALVYGDVNSTLAAALVCAKLGIAVGHVEAGLRSLDRSMPEEVNRLVTDHLSELLFTPSIDGNENLAREGIAREKVHLVGNTMIDTLVRLLPQAKEMWNDGLGRRFGERPYVLATLHRPSNVDEPESLAGLIRALESIGEQIRVLFPAHPRTRQQIAKLGIEIRKTELFEPLSYLEFLALQTYASVVITDSGGIQEETTFLGIPCLTVRENTERPITIKLGTNCLVGKDPERLRVRAQQILAGERKQGTKPPLWDGYAGRRIAEIVLKWGAKHGRYKQARLSHLVTETN